MAPKGPSSSAESVQIADGAQSCLRHPQFPPTHLQFRSDNRKILPRRLEESSSELILACASPSKSANASGGIYYMRSTIMSYDWRDLAEIATEHYRNSDGRPLALANVTKRPAQALRMVSMRHWGVVPDYSWDSCQIFLSFRPFLESAYRRFGNSGGEL